MTITEAAESLGVATSTVRMQIRRGVIAATKPGREWVVAEEEVERYRRERLGRTWSVDPERRLARLRSPETRAKMSAAKADWKPTQAMADARRGRPLTAAHREKLSAAQRGRPFEPEHLEALRAAHQRPEYRANVSAAHRGLRRSPETRERIRQSKVGTVHTAEHRARISAGIVRAIIEGRRARSPLEVAAAVYLDPRGYRSFLQLDGHAFDFASPDGRTVVEVNSCRLHDHRLEDPACPRPPLYRRPSLNTAYRRIAAERGLRLVELWECQRERWPEIIAALP